MFLRIFDSSGELMVLAWTAHVVSSEARARASVRAAILTTLDGSAQALKEALT